MNPDIDIHGDDAYVVGFHDRDASASPRADIERVVQADYPVAAIKAAVLAVKPDEGTFRVSVYRPRDHALFVYWNVSVRFEVTVRIEGTRI